MINVGITGGETESAGELIRILINHPDVLLRQVASEPHSGERVDSFHRGLTGDTDLSFVPEVDVAKLNCVFLVGEPWQAQAFMEKIKTVPRRVEEGGGEESEDMLHVIDMTGRYRGGEEEMVYGLAEYNRKALVRGALRASVPSPVAEVLGMVLFPLAKNHLLQGHIKAKIEMTPPQGVAKCLPPHQKASRDWASALSTRFDPVAPSENRPDAEVAVKEIMEVMGSIDPMLSAELDVKVSAVEKKQRGIIVDLELPTTAGVEELKRLYRDCYDDHSFVYVIDRRPETEDISNTNKCLIYIEGIQPATVLPSSATVGITAVIDNLVKGSAGNAVHCMNLLFGLSERTGLALKASTV